MITHLLDTNALAEPIRARPNAAFMRRLRAHEGRVAIASLTWHEAVYGAARLAPGARRRAIDEYLFDVVRPAIPIVDYDGPAAQWHALERARLEAIGKTPSFVDGQIAAIAATRELVLVTANRTDFEPFEGVRVEWWG
jgi:tRNA(fMet)-specific endonuclease VapC